VDDYGASLSVQIFPAYEDDAPGDWLEQVAALYGSLQAAGSPVELVADPADGARGHGTKGLTEVAEIVLSSVPAIRAANQVLVTWLGRDRQRTITATVRRGSKQTTVTISGDPVSNQSFEQVACVMLAAEGRNDNG
jgi:hypothetical protein